MAGAIAWFAAIGRVVDRFTPAGIAAAWATPGAGIEQPANPPQGVETEIALTTATALIVAVAATAAGAATAAFAASVAINAFAQGAMNGAAIAFAPATALAAATPVSQKSATAGRRQ
jgi:hypothetical protein